MFGFRNRNDLGKLPPDQKVSRNQAKVNYVQNVIFNNWATQFDHLEVRAIETCCVSFHLYNSIEYITLVHQ